MKKVYLLLRNNQQTGPYELDEIVQQQLGPNDLVWVEGVSVAWAYPTEIKEINEKLNGPAPKKSKTATGSSYQRVPDEIELKAEELRQKALSFSPSPLFRKPAVEPEASVKPQMLPLLEEEISFVVHKPKKRIPVNELVTVVLVSGLVLAGIYGNRIQIFGKSKTVNSSAVQVISDDTHPAKAVAPVQQIPAAIVADTASVYPSEQTVANNIPSRHYLPAATGTTEPAEQKPLQEEPVAAVAQENTEAAPDHNAVAGEKPQEEKIKKSTPDQVIKELVKTEDTAVKKTAAATGQVEKKKTLGESLKDIFKKKNKEENQEQPSQQ